MLDKEDNSGPPGWALCGKTPLLTASKWNKLGNTSHFLYTPI
jgi:hypothetical protein